MQEVLCWVVYLDSLCPFRTLQAVLWISCSTLCNVFPYLHSIYDMKAHILLSKTQQFSF